MAETVPFIDEGSRAPDFRLPTLVGAEVALTDLLGDNGVLLFFAKADCPTTQYAAPFVNRLANRLANALGAANDAASHAVVCICQEERVTAEVFANDHRLKMPVLLDPGPSPVSGAYGLQAVPVLALVGSDGVVRKVVVGFQKVEYETTAAMMAADRGVEAPDLWEGADDIPAMKPG